MDLYLPLLGFTMSGFFPFLLVFLPISFRCGNVNPILQGPWNQTPPGCAWRDANPPPFFLPCPGELREQVL